MTELALRPRSATEIIDLAVRLLRRHFGAFVAIALIGVVPTLLVQLLFLAAVRSDPATLFPRITGYGMLSFVVLLVVRSLMLAALLVGADEALRVGTVDVGAALRRGAGRIGVAVGVSLLSSVAIGVGFLLLIVPAIYVALRLATALPAAVVEGDGVFDALQRAWARSEGHLLHTLKTLLLLALIFVVFGVVVGAITFVVALLGRGSTAGISLFLVASQVIGSLLMTAVYPLLTNTLLLLTYDLRVRREGYDVEAMADALGTAR